MKSKLIKSLLVLSGLIFSTNLKPQAMASENQWFDNATYYQVFIKGFKDSDGDGNGDIKGLISKLDYIKSLGVDAIYLNPVSKQKRYSDKYCHDDLGYETLDLKDIEPTYGTKEDFKELIKQAHKRNLKIILDFLSVGVSPEHPIFQDMVKNGENSKYKDWFITKDQPEAGWMHYISGEPWVKLPDGRYYYSLFWAMPFPNYKNPVVQEYFMGVADFWLGLGVDGFRADAAKFLVMNGPGVKNQEHQPETFLFWKELKKRMTEKYGKDKVMIAEIIPIPYEFDYIGKNREIFDFLWDDVFAAGIFSRDSIEINQFSPKYFSSFLEPTGDRTNSITYLSNHDRGRISAKLSGNNNETGKLLASMLFFMHGKPMIYFGDEIGLKGYKIKNPGKDAYLNTMAWDKTLNGGFSTNKEPHARISKDYDIHNVELESKNPDSVLNYYKKLISFRKKNPLFADGKLKSIKQINPKIYSYFLHSDNKVVLVLHNLSEKAQKYDLDLSRYTLKRKLSMMFGKKDISFEVKNNAFEVKNIMPYNSLVFSLDGATAKDIEEIVPNFSKSLSLDKYTSPSKGKYSDSRNVYSITDNSEQAVMIEDIKTSKEVTLSYYNSKNNRIHEINFSADSSSLLPFPSDSKYFSFSKDVNFKLVPFDWEKYFSKKTRKVLESKDNKTLKSFSYGKDNNFWYFKIEKEKMALQTNGGLDFDILIDDPQSETGSKKIGFWSMPEIHTDKTIENMIGLQYQMVNSKPKFYSDTNDVMQPGVSSDKNIIFHESKDAFYILLNREELPKDKYNISIIVWSAGGAWGDKYPEKYPITEMLPDDKNEMNNEHPKNISKFLQIN